ncbi:protein NLRC5-like isoform X21 [Ctenopharyngodon idella]|uniref:protein NLRC5-like isoform X21 n=1 Tax=Ctenopharyngodon idella TaxID=7959 RepID=UPI002231C24B|nr:protein NLRC5-like isoform X21 [Ctenopharyngodon idella]
MSEERGNDSLSKMSLSEKQRERSDSEVSSSESVKSDQSKGDVPYFTEETPTKSERSDSDPHVSFNEETPSQSKSERSGSPVFSSVSMKSDHSKGDGPNFSENKTSPAKSERSGSPVFSSVSMKSDHSKGDGPNFSENKTSPAKSERSGPHVSFSEATPSQIKSERSGSPVFSSVSMKSDHSKGDGPNFSENKTSPAKSQRLVSYESSSVSVKSDHSKGDGPNFSEKKPSSTKSKKSGSHVSFSKETPSRTKSVRSDSHVSSSVSVKSDHSKGDGPNFSEKTPSKKSVRSGSHVSSFVSMKSDHSKGDGPNFSEETPSPSKSNRGQKTTVNIGAEFSRWKTLKAQKGLKSDVELATFLLNRVQFEKSDSDYKNYRNRKDFRENLLWIFKAVENKILIFLKNELEKFKKILKKENTQYFVQDFIEEMRDVKEAALDMTLFFLRDMKQVEAADALQDELVLIHQRPLKSNLKKKHQSVSEGIAKHGDSKLLNNIYTDLYMTLGAIKQVNTQHEVRQVQVADRRHESQEIAVECKNLFKAPEQDKEIRTVLTKGVAGIGKSISVQKFIVDWAEGKENKDITFIFPLAFREMNLKEKEKQSLTSLISQFFPEIKGLNLARNDKFKFLFILDGLDECRLPLNFDGNETCRDVSSPVSLDVLLTNLIKGNLLPSALIWITTRPAAAIKIPPECIDRVTEVQGFNDAQKKEEYFRKRFTDVDLANEIIDNVKQSKSLFIMCYIPVFCWISATVLQNILEEKRNNDLEKNKGDDTSKTLQESNTEDTPRTLTQMYTHFLRFQILQSRRKYEGKYTPNISWDKDAILSLGKLAFHQLQRNNLLFYNTDLESCGIDASKASVYSGMCTQIFKEEKGIILGTTFCFVHLSIQEFIAALYAHLFLDINKKSVFVQESTKQENKNEDMIDLLKTAVDKALESDTGHLDLFLRFLLGLSLQTNRPLLRGLLTQQDDNDQSNKEIVQYIKQKLEENLSPERSINLFYCLNELNDQTLVKAIQTQLREGSLSSADLSPAQWSAVAFVLLTSEEEMKEFELQKFKKSDECLFRLLEVVKISKRAVLNDCNITDKSCSSLAKALESDNNLKELIMDSNNLQDAGVRLLCAGLNSVKCKLEILRLSKCDLTEESCSALASVLNSDSSSLKHLDLSNNNLKDSGVKFLSDGLKENCKLEKLKLSNCNVTEEGYKALASALKLNPSHLIKLELRGNDPGLSGVEHLLDVLQKPDCKLKIRFLSTEAEKVFQKLTDVLGKNLLLLRELNLNECQLGYSELKKLVPVLEDKHCKLNTMILNDSFITEEDCRALAAALNLNPSNLKELDLSRSILKDSGMKILSSLFSNVECRLEKLKLSDCSITEEGYKTLASALRSNPSHLIELDLTGNDPGQSGVKELNDLLQIPNCQLKTLRFLSPAADEACQYVNRVVGKNPLLLNELNLSGHKLEDSNVKQLAVLLEDKHCKLNILQLSNNSVAEEGCAALTSAFNSNPSNLIELDLSGNKLGNSGIVKICPLLKNTQCRLEKLKLSDCSVTEEGYKALASALRSNSSHLIELDLTGNDPGQSGVKQLLNVLQKPGCKLTLRFLKTAAAEEACDYLSGVVGTNPLLLTKLDLSKAKLGDLDGEKLSALLMDSHSKVEIMTLNNCELTEKSCSVLATVLSSKTILKELNLNNSCLLDSGVKEICEGLKNPVCKLKILKLSKCDLTEESCLAIASVLSSDSSSLKDLDLSDNNLKDSGVKLLSDGLKENCKLENLRLSGCSITEEGYKSLASALRSNPSHLIELDLRGNDPGQSGVKELSDLLQDPNCKLTMRFLNSDEADEACKFLTRDLSKNPLLLRELNVSDYKLDLKKVKQLAALLVDKHCKLNIIQLNNNGITADGCAALTSALISNPSNLTELDLSGNKLGKSGVEHICHLLANMQCTLKKLKLSYCSITGESYKTLVSVLESIPLSHLIELDLTGNYPGRFGLNWLFKLLGHGMTISFLSPAAKEACEYLTNVLGTNPLLLQELDLSSIKLGDMDWEKISALLVDSHCIVEKIKLNNCELTNKSCSVLATVLSKNNNLKEMDLNNSRLLYSGVKQICEGLKNTVCKLKILKLSNCSISEEGYKALASALSSNPSHLIELDLTGNDPGQSGVKEFIDLLQNRKCSLKKLSFLEGPAAEAYQYLTEVLGIKYLEKPLETLLFLRDLNLSEHKLGDTGVNQIAVLLQDKHCKPNTLMLRDCGLTEKSCSTLATVLRSNSSLKKLDISNNNLQDSGVKKLQNGLENTNCKLKTLSLLNCSITEEGFKALASALRSNPSHLIELDLTGNDPGQSGVKELNVLLQSRHNSLKSLRFLSPDTEKACQYVHGLVGKNPLFLNELNLSEHKLGDTNVKDLAALLKDKHCQFNTVTLFKCSFKEHQCSILTLALKSNPSQLRELNLSGNNLGVSGVKNLSDLLMNPQCKLEKLHLCGCSITEEQCLILTSALKSNPSHLRELDLSGNKIKNTEVKHLCDVLKDALCKLERLSLRGCEMTDEDCSAVTSALKSNPSHLRELELSGNRLGDSGVENLSDLLMQCKLEIFNLSGCSITEKQCLILTSALKSNPSHLRELNLSGNKLKNTGVNHLCDVLKDSHCKLERLSLNECGITDVSSLTRSLTKTKALQCLKELDLSNNKIGKSKEQLSKALQESNCELRLDSESFLKRVGGFFTSWF